MVKLHQVGIVTVGLLLASFGRLDAQAANKAQVVGLFEVSFNAQMSGSAIGIPVVGFPFPADVETSGVFAFAKSPQQLDLVSAAFHYLVNLSSSVYRTRDGTFVLVAADGATLTGTFVGAIRPAIEADPLGRGRSYWLITKGTGRFAGAMGSGNFTSEIGIGAGGSETAILEWKGVVAIPNPRP